MAETRPFSSLADEETVHLKWFEAFMRGRVELEQQTILGLQALLEGAPPLPDRKLLWHRALEELLDGTRDELNIRIEELEKLKDQMQAVGISITNAKMYIRDLNFEVEKLKSTEDVDSAQAVTVTLHKDWLDIKSVDISVQKGLSNLFSSARARNEKLENDKQLQDRKTCEALEKYHKQDLKYRRIVHQKRQSQKQFLNSIPDRVQKYGTKYWTAVCDVGTVMESFANYLRNVSSTCNSSGSAIWASAKNIKPLVDANCHTEAIEIVYHKSPIRFSPIHYRNPGSKSRSPSAQTMLFGCPLELYTVGKLKKIPPVLEYLLDSVHDWPRMYFDSFAMEECWPLVNKLEQAWTGVEERDRAIVSNLDNHRLLIMAYLMVLPEPVWSDGDIKVVEEVILNPSSPISNTWSKGPTKLAVLRAMASCLVRLRYKNYFSWDIVNALAQKSVPVYLHYILSSPSRYPDFWRPPASTIPEGTL